MNLPALHKLRCHPCVATGTALVLGESILCNICWVRITGGPVIVAKEEDNELTDDYADLSEAVRKQLVVENGGNPVTTDPSQFKSLRFKAPFYTPELEPKDAPTYIVACASFPPHIFHEQCLHDHIRTQLKMGSEPNCPECRGPLIGKADAMRSAVEIELAQEDDDLDDSDSSDVGLLDFYMNDEMGATVDQHNAESYEPLPMEDDDYVHPAARLGIADFITSFSSTEAALTITEFFNTQGLWGVYNLMYRLADRELRVAGDENPTATSIVGLADTFLARLWSCIKTRMEANEEYRSVMAVMPILFTDEDVQVGRVAVALEEIPKWMAMGGLDSVATELAGRGAWRATYPNVLLRARMVRAQIQRALMHERQERPMIL